MERNTPRLMTFVVTAAVLLGGGACHAQRLVAPPAYPYDLEVLVDGYPQHVYYRNGRGYLLGSIGDRYEIRVTNRSDRRIEAVVTVDGRDAIDGRKGDFQSKRGYVIAPHDSVTVDGWRLSRDEVAAFRFSSVRNSYAARMGDVRNVGVIGVAIFPEKRRYRPPRPVWRPRPRPFPDSRAEGKGRDRYYDEDSLADAEEAAPPAAGLGSAGDYDHGARESRSKSARRGGRSRPGLGTAYGERRWSETRETTFRRANHSRPAKVLALFYNDRDGLLALGIDPGPPYYYDDDDDDHWRRWFADPFPEGRGRRYSEPPPGW